MPQNRYWYRHSCILRKGFSTYSDKPFCESRADKPVEVVSRTDNHKHIPLGINNRKSTGGCCDVLYERGSSEMQRVARGGGVDVKRRGDGTED
jgi:hypothetical protein